MQATSGLAKCALDITQHLRLRRITIVLQLSARRNAEWIILKAAYVLYTVNGFLSL